MKTKNYIKLDKNFFPNGNATQVMLFIYFLKDPGYCTRIRITTKDFGEANSWTFGSCTSDRTYEGNQEYTQDCCLSGTVTDRFIRGLELICKTSKGDGWHGGYIEIQDIRYCEDFQTGSELKMVLDFSPFQSKT